MITYKDIKPYIEKGLISEQVHPENNDVRIFNYTHEVQFSKAWDEVTSQCRGLILNIATGEVLARPFPKFFNYEEHIAQGKTLPNEKPIISEKMDGSLGILYALNGKPWIATRGSFTSDQALWATDWWRKNVGDVYHQEPATHLFEIIFPENRIVVCYDFSGLVHLDSIDIEKGTSAYYELPIKRAAKIEADDITTLSKMDTPNSEGFVIYYANANLRLKIKFAEYVRLHKILTGLSEIGIWEHLRQNKDINALVEKVPDEFYAWVGSISERLCNEHGGICDAAKAELENIYALVGQNATRKELANVIRHSNYSGLLFALLDKKDISDAVWKMVRPKGKSIFKKDIDS